MGAQSKYQGVVQEIIQNLEEEIVMGRLYPRERLIEEDLVARFEIKRHAVQQVLKGLESMGLVVRESGKGATVREFSKDEVIQLYQTREIVEGQAAMMIDLPVPVNQWSRLEGFCQQYADAVDRSDMRSVIKINKQFHQEFYRLCGNDFLADVIDSLAKQANLVRFAANVDPKYLGQARDEHFEILNALKAQNNHKLSQLCIAHLQPSQKIYLERMHI